MYIKDFSVENKIFAIRFTENECCKERTGVCPVEDKTNTRKKQEKNQEIYHRSHYDYCKKMEYSFLNDISIKPLDLYLCACGHYHIFDGRHRICIAGHLLEDGRKVNFQAEVQEEAFLCPYCREKERLSKQRGNLSLFDFIFRTRAYKDYRESVSLFDWHLISFPHDPACHYYQQ